MTLRFKRNLPIVITLIAILAVLILVIGNQPIVSYTVNTQAVHVASLPGVTDSLAQLTGVATLVQP